ncbi:hypothetical protein BE61_80640 [Bradyrhizobium elkanii USDA 61]|nr:hypothetical protein BE61_80640 [Bradyrhizobium elkanii USDA 61]
MCHSRSLLRSVRAAQPANPCARTLQSLRRRGASSLNRQNVPNALAISTSRNASPPVQSTIPALLTHPWRDTRRQPKGEPSERIAAA